MFKTALRVGCSLALAGAQLLLAQPSPHDRVLPRVSDRLAALHTEVAPAVAGERIHTTAPLTGLYAERAYAPLWLLEMEPGPTAEEAARLLGRASEHGLEPNDYHHRAIVELLEVTSRGGSPDAALDLELLLSEGLLRYGAHLLSGRLRSGVFDPALGHFRHEIDLAPLIERAAQGDPETVWQELEPVEPAYRHLQVALGQLREVVVRGGWPVVPPGPVLVPGSRASASRLDVLRAGLRASGDLPFEPADSPELDESPFDARLFDATLADALRRFQRRHGLTVDGKLGPATSKALAVPATERLRRIELSLERLRWLPRELGRRHLRVDIPASMVTLVENGEAVLEMRAVVGRPDRKTATFSDQVRYLVFHPYWEVPHNLVIEDELPEIKKEVGYIGERNFEVLRGWGAEERVVDPREVDWARLDRDDFPYRLRQRSGRGNALGRVKFMFPNVHDIYLHDTPRRELFERNERHLSSGCIRLERPLELATAVLEGTPLWNRWLVDDLVESGKQTTVDLLHPMPIHLLYFTAWPDASGTIGFREDIYDLDAGLQSDLDRVWPDRHRTTVGIAPADIRDDPAKPFPVHDTGN